MRECGGGETEQRSEWVREVGVGEGGQGSKRIGMEAARKIAESMVINCFQRRSKKGK